MGRRIQERRKGFALIFSALCCLALIPVVGLAIDGARVYLMRNQVSTALNAAVLAGARSLNLGATVTDQAASAITIATNVFNANITAMGTGINTNASASFSVSENNVSHYRTVTGSATANLPLTLISIILPSGTTTIAVAATAQRRDVNVILALDHSGPMGGAPLAALQADATSFVTTFANTRDSIGLVAFAGGAYVAQTPTQTFSLVTTAIGTLQAPGTSFTNTAAAIWSAYQQLVAVNEPGALNVIVLFTDGVPGSFAGNFAGYVDGPASTNPPNPAISATGGCGFATSPLNGLLMSNPLYPGNRYGLSDYIAQSINDTPDSRAAPGCTSTTQAPNRFLSQMPATDVNGNSTNGTGTMSAYQAVTLTSITGSNIEHAAENAFDDAANKIRSDTTIAPVIYAIGLTLPNGAVPDTVLMERIANDPRSATYSSNQPAGLYLPAPNSTQLATAFANIAAQVLQLARN